MSYSQTTRDTVAFNHLVTEAYLAATDEEYAMNQTEMFLLADMVATIHGFDRDQLMFDVAARVHDLLKETK